MLKMMSDREYQELRKDMTDPKCIVSTAYPVLQVNSLHRGVKNYHER